MMTMFANIVHHQLIAQCQFDVTKITRWGWKDMGLLSWHMKRCNPLPTIHILSPPCTDIVKKVNPCSYDTKVVYKCNATPPKTKKPNFALPISGTAKLNLWNAIPSVNTRQACRGTKSELKIKYRANEYTCILHVVEECKIRLRRY